MKLSFGNDVDEFRREFVEWMTANRPSDDEMRADPARSSAHSPGWMRAWTRRMFDAGWLVPGWPPELGGRNASAIETLVYLEELAEAGVPRTTNAQGLGIVAPSIIDYGTEAQIRDFAMPVLLGERTVCLGMSEPGAGSDLASLSTRAVLDGDHFIINGQKVWTSGANYADLCFLLCRTDPSAPKHKGISIILVDIDTPGLTVRPLPEIVDPMHPDLNEVFFDDVEVPADRLVGQMNNGWAMANGSLAHERGMVWLMGVMRLKGEITRLIDEAPALLAPLTMQERAVAVDRFASLYTDVQAARCLGYRGFARLVRGGTAPEQALMKLYTSEVRQQLALAASEVQGAAAVDFPEPANRRDPTWMQDYWFSFVETISAGSSEIQRNIIAEKVLGLPRG